MFGGLSRAVIHLSLVAAASGNMERADEMERRARTVRILAQARDIVDA